MARYKTCNISIPTDADGFVGRACDAPGCKQYFKIYVLDHRDQPLCPYCGVQFSRNSLLTSSQLNYARKATIEEARVYAIDEFQKMMKKAFRGSTNMTYNPGPKPQNAIFVHDILNVRWIPNFNALNAQSAFRFTASLGIALAVVARIYRFMMRTGQTSNGNSTPNPTKTDNFGMPMVIVSRRFKSFAIARLSK